MRHGHAVTVMAAGALASLVALAACATQAQTQAQEPATTNETIVVTRPTQVRTRAYTRVQPAPTSDARTYVVTRNASPQDPAANETQEIRIERKIVNGEEEVYLWINGKEIEVESMEEVHEAIGKSNIDADVRFFGGGRGAMRSFQFQPGQMQMEVEGFRPPDGAFELTMPQFDVSTLGVFNPPKSMLGVHLEPISDDLRDYLGLAEEAGARVAAVVDDSAAAKAELKKGDIIVAIKAGSESHDGLSVDTLREIISQSEPGTEITLTVLRKGERLTVNATLAEWDGERLGRFGQFDLIEPPATLRGLGGEGLQLELSPTIRRGMREDRLLELQPMMRRLERDTQDVIRRALPDHEEMLRMMEQQLEEVQRLLEGIRQQQEELRRDSEPSNTPDA